MKDPREFPCMDSDPRNNGFGYNNPNPYDDYPEEKIEEVEEEIDLENDCERFD